MELFASADASGVVTFNAAYAMDSMDSGKDSNNILLPRMQTESYFFPHC